MHRCNGCPQLSFHRLLVPGKYPEAQNIFHTAFHTHQHFSFVRNDLGHGLSDCILGCNGIEPFLLKRLHHCLVVGISKITEKFAAFLEVLYENFCFLSTSIISRSSSASFIESSTSLSSSSVSFKVDPAKFHLESANLIQMDCLPG